MTSTIVYVTENSAHLLTDGGMFGPGGDMVAKKQKAIILAHQNAVAAARGPDMFAGLLAVALGPLQGTFDDLATAFPEAFRQAHAAMLAAIKVGHAVFGDPGQVDAVLVGLSERHGFIAYTVASYHDGEVPAFTANPLQPETPLAYSSPFDERMIARLASRGVDVWTREVTVEKHGLELMREQRASTDIVGGFCQLTSVLRGGIFTRILEEWPEKVRLSGLPVGRLAAG